MSFPAGRAFGRPGPTISPEGRWKVSREQETYLRHVEAPVEYGCQDSHIGRYPAEDIAPQHDARDYQEIDAEDIVTHVESGAIEGSLHRPPADRNKALCASVVAAAYRAL